MKKWFLIEDCTTSRAALYHTELKATRKADAVQEGLHAFLSLTEHDRKDRESVFVCKADVDEYGDPDLETAQHLVEIREAGGGRNGR